MSQLAHEAGAHLWFLYREETRSTTCTPHAWVASPSQGPPPSIKFAGTHLYTWMERGIVLSPGIQQNLYSQVSNSDHSAHYHAATVPPHWTQYLVEM